MNSVRNFGAKGNYDLQNRTGDDDTNAFLEAAALGEPVYVPNGVYKISAPIRIKGIIRGEDVRKTRIVQTDANESALEIGGDACLVSELTIQHEQNKQSVSNPWGGGRYSNCRAFAGSIGN